GAALRSPPDRSMLRPFELCEPASVAEASELLLRHGEAARIYAGGTELILAMKEGLIHYDYLVNVKTVPGLAGVRLDADGSLRIGAATPHRVLERDPSVSERFPAIARMEADVANVRVREVGTLGGNLCFAEPHADPGALLQVFDATVRLERKGGARTIPLDRLVADSEAALTEAGRIAARASDAITDLHGSAEYKEHLVGVLLRRAFQAALAAVAGDERR